MRKLLLSSLCVLALGLSSVGLSEGGSPADISEDVSRSTSLAQLHELEAMMTIIEDTAHDFDKGRIRSLTDIVVKVEDVVRTHDLVHLSVTNSYVYLVTRFSFLKDFFRAIVKDENQYAIHRAQEIILEIMKTRGLTEVPRLHFVEANLSQLKEALIQFQKLGIEDAEISEGMSKVNNLLLTAAAVASGGDSYLTFKAVHPLYREISAMYPLFRKYYADQNTAIICGTIFEVNEALGKFSDADRAE